MCLLLEGGEFLPDDDDPLPGSPLADVVVSGYSYPLDCTPSFMNFRLSTFPPKLLSLKKKHIWFDAINEKILP